MNLVKLRRPPVASNGRKGREKTS